MLTAFFDGSGDGTDENCRSLVLGCMAGLNNVWSGFELEWQNVLLRDQGRAEFLHMKEAMQRSGEFAGWTEEQVCALIQGFIGLLQEVTVGSPKEMQGFAVVLDLDDYRALKSEEPALPGPELICAFCCLNNVYVWYEKVLGDRLITPQSMRLIFDRNERFHDPLYKAMESRRLRHLQPRWWFVAPVEKIEDMRVSPGLQAADLLAWSFRRLRNPSDEGWRERVARDVVKCVRSESVLLQGAQLRSAARVLTEQTERYVKPKKGKKATEARSGLGESPRR